MEILYTTAELHRYAETCRRAGQRLGLVPTMGALHEGHLQLVRAAAAACEVVIVSIFINPTQFNNAEDFRLYPRLFDADTALLAPAGCTTLFLPSVEEMYPQPGGMRFDFGALEQIMEGAHRPGHFNGVAIVVSKLFHLSQPHQAYFGQKDWQQVAIVRQLVADLSFQMEVISFPTVREADGLAMSSRNRRLSAAARAVAPRLHKALELAAELVRVRQSPPMAVREAAIAHIQAEPAFRVEYFEVANAHTLQPLTEWRTGQAVVLCVAAYLDDVRLIDNVVVEEW